MNKSIVSGNHGKKQGLIIFIVFLFCILATIFTFSQSFAADKVTVVEGLIENVAGDFIQIKGKQYNIFNVPVKDFGGRDASKAQIKKGVFARIVFEGSKIITVLIDVSKNHFD